MGRLLVIFFFFFLTCNTARADREKEKNIITYYIPVPDVLPIAPMPEGIVRTITPTVLCPARPKYYPSKYFGIDVSKYQKNINWKEVSKDNRVAFVYLKATEGTSLVDRTYKRNLKEARKVGLLVGAYHFFSPLTSAHLQLANFIKMVDPKTQDLIPIIDVEVIPKRTSQIIPFLKRLRTFVKGVENCFGCKPMIYTSQNFYNKYLAGKFLDCPFMFAKYGDEVPFVVDNPDFLVWQFTASGRIRGISGDVDRSCLMNEHSLESIKYKRK